MNFKALFRQELVSKNQFKHKQTTTKTNFGAQGGKGMVVPGPGQILFFHHLHFISLTDVFFADTFCVPVTGDHFLISSFSSFSFLIIIQNSIPNKFS